MAKYLDENGLAEFAGKVKEKMVFIGDSSAGSGYDIDTFGSYSLEEVETPFTWIDGKKIYKKTFQVTTDFSASGSINIGFTPETVVSITGVGNRENSSGVFETFERFWRSDSDWYYFWVRNDTIQYRMPSSFVSTLKWLTFTILYTKS